MLAANGGSPTAPGVRPDLVLLDWTMPRMSGIEVVRGAAGRPVHRPHPDHPAHGQGPGGGAGPGPGRRRRRLHRQALQPRRPPQPGQRPAGPGRVPSPPARAGLPAGTLRTSYAARRSSWSPSSDQTSTPSSMPRPRATHRLTRSRSWPTSRKRRSARGHVAHHPHVLRQGRRPPLRRLHALQPDHVAHDAAVARHQGELGLAAGQVGHPLGQRRAPPGQEHLAGVLDEVVPSGSSPLRSPAPAPGGGGRGRRRGRTRPARYAPHAAALTWCRPRLRRRGRPPGCRRPTAPPTPHRAGPGSGGRRPAWPGRAKDRNVSVAGSKRTRVLAPKSLSQTASAPST